jgi:hypothetical protein
MSPGAAFAVMLGLACILAFQIAAQAREPARGFVRLASALYASLACAALIASLHRADAMLVHEVALLVFALAPTALVLALISAWERPLPAIVSAIVLLVAGAAGLLAMTGAAFVAIAVLFVCVCAILALAARHFGKRSRATLPAIGAALCLIASVAAFLSGKDGADIALATFSSAAMLGLSLACSLKRDRIGAMRG